MKSCDLGNHLVKINKIKINGIKIWNNNTSNSSILLSICSLNNDISKMFMNNQRRDYLLNFVDKNRKFTIS